MALTGTDIWLAIALAQVFVFGTVLVRMMDCVKASAMLFKFAVSCVQAARSIRLMKGGTSTATRIAMIANTAMVSIKLKAREDEHIGKRTADGPRPQRVGRSRRSGRSQRV